MFRSLSTRRVGPLVTGGSQSDDGRRALKASRAPDRRPRLPPARPVSLLMTHCPRSPRPRPPLTALFKSSGSWSAWCFPNPLASTTLAGLTPSNLSRCDGGSPGVFSLRSSYGPEYAFEASGQKETFRPPRGPEQRSYSPRILGSTGPSTSAGARSWASEASAARRRWGPAAPGFSVTDACLSQGSSEPGRADHAPTISGAHDQGRHGASWIRSVARRSFTTPAAGA